MYIHDIIRRSGRSLKSAKGRTILTALAIAVGGFTLTVTMAAGNGIAQYTDRLISSNLDPAELIVARDKEAVSIGGGSGKPKEFDETVGSISFGGGASIQYKQVTDKDVNELKGFEFAETVRESYSLTIRYVARDGGDKKYTASAEAFNSAQTPEFVAGTVPARGDLKPGEVVVPEDYRELLGFKDSADMVGKTIIVNIEKAFSAEAAAAQIQAGALTKDSAAAFKPVNKDFKYEIVAVSKKPATTLAPGPLSILFSSEDSRAIYDYESKDTANYGKYLAVLVHVKDGGDEGKLNNAKAELEKRGYFVKTSKDLQATLNQVVEIFTAMVGIFGMITLIASIFGIINTQYISVLERTREIGLMKSLGMRSRDVRRLFILEAGWIGFMGGLLGSIGGILLAVALNPIINKKWGLEFIFQPVQIVGLIVVLILVAILAGYLPARKAARLDPIEALRTE